MSKYTQIHGAAWDDHIANSSSALGRGWSMEDGMGLLTDQTGFRLVFEVAFEAYRGSMHNRTPDVACGPDRCLVSPLRSHRTLGFRLIREEDT